MKLELKENTKYKGWYTVYENDKPVFSSTSFFKAKAHIQLLLAEQAQQALDLLINEYHHFFYGRRTHQD